MKTISFAGIIFNIVDAFRGYSVEEITSEEQEFDDYPIYNKVMDSAVSFQGGWHHSGPEHERYLEDKRDTLAQLGFAVRPKQNPLAPYQDMIEQFYKIIAPSADISFDEMCKDMVKPDHGKLIFSGGWRTKLIEFILYRNDTGLQYNAYLRNWDKVKPTVMEFLDPGIEYLSSCGYRCELLTNTKNLVCYLQ